MALTKENRNNDVARVCIKKEPGFEEKEENLTSEIDIEDVEFNEGNVKLEEESNGGDASPIQQGHTVASLFPTSVDESKSFALQDVRGVVVSAPNAVFDAEKLSSSVEQFIKKELETGEQETKMFLFVECSAEDPSVQADNGESNYNALAETVEVEEINTSNREKHLEKSIKCFNCSASFRFLSDLETHMTIYHTPAKMFYCRFCSAVLPSGGALSRHESSHTRNNIKKCLYCSKLFQKDQFDAHMFVHVREKRFACHLCPNKYLTDWHLKKHLALHVVINNEHMRPDSEASLHPSGFRNDNKTCASIRSSERLYFCCYCQRQLLGNSAVNEHEGLMHPGKKLKPCVHCSATFPSTREMKAHMIVGHASERPYLCPLCPNRYRSRSDLKRHSRSHSEDRPYSCSYCSSSFRQPVSLQDHLLKHIGEKRFCCAHCPSRFYKKKNVELHLRIHSHKELSKEELEQELSVKPYFCTICFARFTNTNSRKRHMKNGSCDRPQALRNKRPMPSLEINS